MSMNQDYRDKLLIELSNTMAVNTALMSEVKEDLKEHMKRTHQNEIRVEAAEKQIQNTLHFVKKHIFAVQITVGLITFIGTALTILTKLGVI